MTARALLRIAAAVILAAGATAPAQAIPAPVVDPAMVPADAPPGPEEPMRQSNLCAAAVAAPHPDVNEPAPGFAALGVESAWQFSTGAGVTVAVIDTGVTPNPRLHVLAGGDYITGGDGLSDCDAHGTVVASVIAAKPSPSDGVAGIAPDAVLMSIRQSSRAFQSQNPAEARKAGTAATLARAVVHAANLGAKVINVSVAACVPAADPLDQRSIGAAVWYAATVKDAVVVAAAGNQDEDGCAQNPAVDSLDPGDPRDWHQVRTVSSPSWFSDYVLAVGAVDPTGAPVARSLAGPWVGVGAPGTAITGLSPRDGQPVNAYPPARPGEAPVPFWGTSFAAAYVSGVAALVRAKFPALTARRVIRRIKQTAHSPARGVDNQVGYGLVDPVAALTYDVGPDDRAAPGSGVAVLTDPAEPPPPDRRAHRAAAVFAATLAACALLIAVIARAGKARCNAR